MSKKGRVDSGIAMGLQDLALFVLVPRRIVALLGRDGKEFQGVAVWRFDMDMDYGLREQACIARPSSSVRRSHPALYRI